MSERCNINKLLIDLSDQILCILSFSIDVELELVENDGLNLNDVGESTQRSTQPTVLAMPGKERKTLACRTEAPRSPHEQDT